MIASLVGTFAWPLWLLALPIPLVVAWARRNPASVGDALRLPIGDRIAAVAGRRTSASASRWPSFAALTVWALLCIAAARPQQLGVPVQPPLQGRDLMLALDLSGSMSEPDMALGGAIVDRLTAAKAVLSDFIDRRAGDRVSLLIFGREAYVLTPPTTDRDTVREQLADSVVGLAGQETAIGDAIGLSTRRLRDQATGERVLVLLTDGVNTAGTLDPIRAARIAADEGVRIHTIAFGSDGTMSLFGLRLPMPGGDYADPKVLRDVASITGGRFFEARDTAQLAGIYAEIDRIEPVARAGQAVRPRIERYAWPLAAAFAVLVVVVALRAWRAR